MLSVRSTGIFGMKGRKTGRSSVLLSDKWSIAVKLSRCKRMQIFFEFSFEKSGVHVYSRLTLSYSTTIFELQAITDLA